MHSPKPNTSGFTLVEIMVTTFISSIVLAMVAGITLESSVTMFKTQHKLGINSDIRELTQKLFLEARASNTFYVYNSISKSDREDVSDRKDDGESGDMIALFQLEPHPTILDPEHATGIIIYHWETVDGGESPIMRIEHTFSSPMDFSESSPEALLDVAVNQGSSETLVAHAQGLVNGHLFHNSRGKTVIVNGQIIHGNSAKEVTDTYGFAISPRG
ncbi:MAG: PulJ/GspJ family protein [Opitutales bacterium]